MTLFIEMVEKQPKVREWVPIEERWPEENQYVLLSFENFTMPLIGRYETDKEGGAFYVGDDEESCAAGDLFVNTWMPLPERVEK